MSLPVAPVRPAPSFQASNRLARLRERVRPYPCEGTVIHHESPNLKRTPQCPLFQVGRNIKARGRVTVVSSRLSESISLLGYSGV